ncbi:hypothetical protein VHEMI07811 [[Torrubiella] hemipterigena]|uniref:Uncharacterized protein n=1 Tax=[Torrubiella] hemipterigena TaxID=1531966 RepID=A0A0A1TNM5_9HYPO|nr:hypothetical protein VHEMI07811 [[Torrubiella] hemipterigena]
MQMSTEDAVKALTSTPSTITRALELVAGNNQQMLLLQQEILRNISILDESRMFLQQFLSKINEPVAEITSDVLHAVAAYFDPDTLRAFIAKSSQQSLQILDLLSSAKSNWKWKDVMLEVIFELAPAAEFWEQIQFRLTHSTSIEEMSTLLRKTRQVPTKELVTSVNGILLQLRRTTPLSSEDKLAVLKHLLERCSNMDDMDGVNFQLAVAYCPLSAIDLLLEYLPRNCVTGEIILSAAARNRTDGPDIMERLLEMQEPYAAVASRVIISAVQNNINALKFLLELYGDEMKITADILMYARGYSVFDLLLFYTRDDVMAAAPMALHLASRYDRKHLKLRKMKSLLS